MTAQAARFRGRTTTTPPPPRRRWTWTTASFADLKQIRAAHGGTINDVVLAAITGAFRDLLEQRGEPAHGGTHLAWTARPH